MNNLTVLLGHTALTGKDTFCRFLIEELEKIGIKGKRFAFADPLKDIAYKFTGWDGKKNEKGREILKFIGAYLGAEYEETFKMAQVNSELFNIIGKLSNIFTPSKQFWSDLIYKQMLLDNETAVRIITDFRYKKEYYGLKYTGLNIHTIKIVRTPPRDNSKSENDLLDFNFDSIIDNKGSLEYLRENARLFISQEIYPQLYDCYYQYDAVTNCPICKRGGYSHGSQIGDKKLYICENKHTYCKK